MTEGSCCHSAISGELERLFFYNRKVSLSTLSAPFAPSASRCLEGWDEFDAYLFDIDGTLLRDPERIHFLAFGQCLREVMGREIPLNGITVHGSTDPAILRDAFRAADISESDWTHLEPRILARLSEIVVAQRATVTMKVMPGVARALDHLRSRGVALGVATGNLEAIGWLKLEVAGLRDYFTFGGFSDSYPLRADMIAHAAALARAHAGAAARVCIVGDTPSDIAAARANRLPTIAVATGIFSVDQLAEHNPFCCVPTLEALLAPPGGVPPSSSPLIGPVDDARQK